MRDVAVVIPAYRPDSNLLPLSAKLLRLGFAAIVVVDDGSGSGFDEVFRSLPSGVRLVRHAVNRGKGSALKSGIETALREYPGLRAVVTADADGQHLPADIAKVAAKWSVHPDHLILGTRVFDGAVPLRSRFGNELTRHAVHLLIGEKLRDTQTGLRAIPAGFAASLLDLPSHGYDFELDMLIAARNQSVPFLEEPIETVYLSGNRSSHFNPLFDSMKIYFVLTRFCSVALATAAIDNLVFYAVYRGGHHLLWAQAAGRTAGVAFNYWMVKKRVFRVHARDAVTLPRYLGLVVASGIVSYILIRAAGYWVGAPVLLAKIVAESVLFFVNFAIERDWVFVR